MANEMTTKSADISEDTLMLLDHVMSEARGMPEAKLLGMVPDCQEPGYWALEHGGKGIDFDMHASDSGRIMVIRVEGVGTDEAGRAELLADVHPSKFSVSDVREAIREVFSEELAMAAKREQVAATRELMRDYGFASSTDRATPDELVGSFTVDAGEGLKLNLTQRVTVWAWTPGGTMLGTVETERYPQDNALDEVLVKHGAGDGAVMGGTTPQELANALGSALQEQRDLLRAKPELLRGIGVDESRTFAMTDPREIEPMRWTATLVETYGPGKALADRLPLVGRSAIDLSLQGTELRKKALDGGLSLANAEAVLSADKAKAKSLDTGRSV